MDVLSKDDVVYGSARLCQTDLSNQRSTILKKMWEYAGVSLGGWSGLGMNQVL